MVDLEHARALLEDMGLHTAAELLDTLDNLITIHQRELGKLQSIKKALLEKMFV